MRQRIYTTPADRQRAYRECKRNAIKPIVTLPELPTPYYQDSQVTLYCGDCCELLPLLADSSVDVTLSDPPYNVGLDYSDGDNRADYPAWCERWFRLCSRPLVFTPGIENLPIRWEARWFSDVGADSCLWQLEEKYLMYPH